MAQSLHLGEYLPKVLRRSDWLILDISEKPCDACGKFAEYHSWGILDVTGQIILFCSECEPIHQLRNINQLTAPFEGKVFV